jgi:hypothetical protein
MHRRPAGGLELPPVAGALAGEVPRRQPLEDDDVVVDAGGEEVLGVVAGEAREDGARAGQVELLEGGSPVGVGLVDQQVAVEPEEVEGPEGERRPIDVEPGDAGVTKRG